MKLFGGVGGVAKSVENNVDVGTFGAVLRTALANGEPTTVPDDLDAACPLQSDAPFLRGSRRVRCSIIPLLDPAFA
jgi:hypothetical protein